MTRYARGDRALGICDRCGQTQRLNRLRFQVIDKRNSGMRVCPSCLDIDQEQLQVGSVRADDAIALNNPRPDSDPGREPLTDPIVIPVLNSP